MAPNESCLVTVHLSELRIYVYSLRQTLVLESLHLHHPLAVLDHPLYGDVLAWINLHSNHQKNLAIHRVTILLFQSSYIFTRPWSKFFKMGIHPSV